MLTAAALSAETSEVRSAFSAFVLRRLARAVILVVATSLVTGVHVTRLFAGNFWLSDTPDVVGSRGWDAKLPRIVTWVELRDLKNDRRPMATV